MYIQALDSPRSGPDRDNGEEGGGNMICILQHSRTLDSTVRGEDTNMREYSLCVLHFYYNDKTFIIFFVLESVWSRVACSYFARPSFGACNVCLRLNPADDNIDVVCEVKNNGQLPV